MRICAKHFHHSVVNCDSKGNLKLKLGAAPTLFWTKFSLMNEEDSENKCLSRTVGDLHDHQCVYNHETRKLTEI